MTDTSDNGSRLSGNIVDINKPVSQLRMMARAIAYATCPYDDALEFLDQAYRMGVADGECKAYRAQLRAEAARVEERARALGERAKGKEASNG